MARMIPSRVYADTKSKGELEIFQRLRDDPNTSDWIVLHSLDIAQHARRLAGEIDFVVIVPTRGVICLEVKAVTRIRREDGMWFYGSNPKPDSRGPFRQASEAMHSIRSRIINKRPDLGGVLFWSAVIFPYLEFNISSNEWHDWQVINGTTFRLQPISNSLLSIFDKAREYVLNHGSIWFRPENKVPTVSQCNQIASILRPDFEFFIPPKIQRAELELEIKKYTEEQFIALDVIDSNDRVVFSGPAGTGKTLLAIEAARRSRAQGRKVLLLCFNKQLGRRLEDDTTALQPEVTVSHLHKYMLSVLGGYPSKQEVSPNYWHDELPDKAIEKMLEYNTDRYIYDELIIDEAQDILRQKYLDFLDLSVKGGLRSGCWRLFGDFERQAIYDTAADVTLADAIKTRLGMPAVFSLRVNCRNTPRIATLVHLLGNLAPGYSRILRPDDRIEPKFKYYAGTEQQVRQLVETLDELLEYGYTYSDIVILSTRANSSAVASKVTGKWGKRLRPFDEATHNHVRYGSVHSFKGLESYVVIVTDVEQISGEKASSLFYVAMTRPLQRLTILASIAARAEILQMLL